MKDIIGIKEIKAYINEKLMELKGKDGVEYRFIETYRISIHKFIKGEKEFKDACSVNIEFSNLIVEEEKKKIDEAIEQLKGE